MIKIVWMRIYSKNSKVIKMNKFVVLESQAGEIIANVSQITVIVPKVGDNKKCVVYFSDGNSATVNYSKVELLEIIIGKPWYINIINAIKMLFKGKR